MPWVRIDEHALNHVKLLSLTHGAFRLWVEGLAYCQRHLTDGAIPMDALRTFRYASVKAVAELTTSIAGGSSLWVPDAAGYHVHDFLDWNEDRARVHEKREQARQRMSRLRGGDDRLHNGDPPRSREQPANNPRTVREQAAHVRCTTTTTTYTPPVLTDPEPGEKRAREDTDDEIAHRAGAFVDRYREAHQRYRHVVYLGNPRKDYEEALQLVQAYDDATLDRLVIVFLNANDDFVRNGTATIAKFRSRASWCQERVQAAGLA
jgi:hypothetical protein